MPPWYPALTDLVEKILLGAIRFVTEFFRRPLAQQLKTLDLARRFGELLSFHRPRFLQGNQLTTMLLDAPGQQLSVFVSQLEFDGRNNLSLFHTGVGADQVERGFKCAELSLAPGMFQIERAQGELFLLLDAFAQAQHGGETKSKYRQGIGL